MDISRKIARIIYPHFRFGESNIDDAIKLVEFGFGGFCLYGGSVEEVMDLIRTLRSKSSHPLIFAADYENGVGQWVSGATKLPSNMAFAATNDESFCLRKAQITAIESDVLGVDWVFAPVLDLADNHKNPIVNLRSFSDDVNVVRNFAKSYISGLKSFNVLNSLKHFPGHGSTDVDSHMVLPEIKKNLEELEDYELAPFKSLISMADSIMVGHLKIPALDIENPSSLSKNVITDLLRNRMGYDGVIITDALMMKAIDDDNKAGVNAFIAGADILLYPNDPYKLHSLLFDSLKKEIITEQMIDKAIERQDELIRKRRILQYKTKDISVIGCPEHKKFVEEIAPKSISWVKKIKLPIDKKICYKTIVNNSEDEKFIEELKNLGFEIKSDINDCDTVVFASFSKPKAFSGKINMDEKEKQEIENILNSNKKLIFVSFGSPFVFDGYIKRVYGAVSCFSDLSEFQISCARGLAGKCEFFGQMPVKIYESFADKL